LLNQPSSKRSRSRAEERFEEALNGCWLSGIGRATWNRVVIDAWRHDRHWWDRDGHVLPDRMCGAEIAHTIQLAIEYDS
jgi:hypothetical protein